MVYENLVSYLGVVASNQPTTVCNASDRLSNWKKVAPACSLAQGSKMLPSIHQVGSHESQRNCQMVAPFSKNETGCIPGIVIMMSSADTPSNQILQIIRLQYVIP